MIILGFETTDNLNESGNSTVYRARPLDGPLDGSGNAVLKVLKGDHPSPQRLARFKREFDTAAQFESPRILKIFRQEPFANTLVSIVEDFDADSLANWIANSMARGGLSLREKLSIAVAICEGLADIHRLGVIHKDITPSNILWNRATNTVKITGFGISLPIERSLSVPYAAGVLEGTLSSMSPEQTGRMNRPLDYRSDFYSLGVTLYELFTGEKPFLSEDPLEMIHCHIAKRPVPPALRRSETPEALSNIILKLMEKNAEDRYQSTEGIKADLAECSRQLESDGTIQRTPPIGHDVSSQFQLSAKLYGREQDVTILFDAFERVLAGELAFTLVNGYSGVGKSSLVQELYRPLTVARGRYVAGKYDQYQRSIPYSAIGQALNSFCDQLLCEAPEVVQSWRGRLLSVVGKNGAALVEMIPRLENLIGPQPPLPEREPLAAQNLLKQLCQDFVQAICRPQEPLVLFLDDLQWADIASLSLLKSVLSNSRLHGLHLVGAYRDNEVDGNHPLVLMLDELTQAGLAFATIHLANLSHKSVAALIADSLSATVPEVSELAEITHSKTHGNAFFTTEFLKALYADGLVQFDAGQRRWKWDAAGIHARQMTDNVVTLMAGRMALLPKPTQTLLKFAACIGSQFHLRALAVVAQSALEQSQVLESLLPALGLGVVVSGAPLATCSQNDIDLTQNTFKFQHDRVQQAAYSLIPETERAAFHLHIAHRLLADASEFGGLDGTLFEIVGHFNKGMGCLGNREERLQAARLNLQAGLKARKSSAFHASWDHFRIAHQLLPKDSFETDYELALPIHLGLAKSSYLAGKCEGSEALYCLLLEKARTRLDKSQVHIVQMEEHHLCGAYDKAIEVQKQNLSLLGEQFPENEQEFSQAIERELRLTTMYRGTRNMDDLIAFRKIDSPEIVEALKTFMSLWISAYLVAHESLVQWCSIRMANLCLQHGNSDMAAFAYVQYGFLCISRLEKFEEGYEYGDLALKLADRCDSLELRGKTYFMFAMCIGHWKTHVSLATETLRKGYAFSSEGGDWTYAVYAAIHIISNLTIAGAPCDAINAEAEKYLEFLQDKAAVGLNAFFVPSALCSLLNLQGKTRARGDFSCQYLDEQVFLNTLCGSQPNIGAWFYTQKLRSSFHYRCFEPAARLIADTENIGRILPTQFLVHEAHFYSCLTMAAAELLSPDAANLEHYWSLFDRYEQKMKLWAEHCPENYLHKYYLIRAERARVEHGDLNEVLTWYDKAIQTAREGNFPNDVALGHELKGRYWLERRQKDYGLFDLKEARYRYQLWGAAGKVAMLEEEFSELAFREDQEAVITPAHLDLLSVHKAARAISAKIEVRDLIQTMMTIVMESAGADRGALLLEKDGAWQIEACADVGDQGIEIDFPANSRQLPKKASSSGVPYSVVNYVLRTQTPLTVSEPLRDHRFGQDPYVISVIPRSILCVPVVHLGRTSGIIYLENKLGPDVFSADRRDLIDVLAGQIAISLENAALYADLKNTVAQQSKMMEELNRVSAQRQIAEAETQRLNAELEERVQDRTAELTRSNQELEQFAYVASHDLQEPLRKVSSFAQLLASQYRGKLDADADEFLGYMVDGARRMQSLIQNLLSYSRLGRKGTPFALVDVNLVLEQALFNLQGAMDDSGAEITSCPLPTVLADEAQLVQLFQNLIGNAIKFHGTEKTRIQIGAESNGTACTFSVRDNGIGIDPQYAERIFQIFQRLHTREEYPGTGIGLSFCKKIVERHGGRIWVESQLPVHGISTGTAFHFTLPQNGATNHEHP